MHLYISISMEVPNNVVKDLDKILYEKTKKLITYENIF